LGRVITGSLGLLALAVLAVCAVTTSAASSAAVTSQGQVESGAAVFGDWCAICHGAAAEGGEGPALDRRTLASYRSADRLFRFVSVSMPGDLPGILNEQEYFDVVAFLLDMNGMNPDGVPVDGSTLADIPLTN
jgi:mono/diheme cytochrome c family protein